MKKGCLILLVLWIAGGFVNYWLLTERGITFAWYTPVLLGLGICITAANIAGITQGLKRRAAASRGARDWREGVLIGLSGRITPLKGTMVAPISGRQVVMYEYEVNRITRSNDSTSTTSIFAGFGMVPCGVSGPRGIMKFVGFPLMNPFKQDFFDEEPDVMRAASYFQETTWTPHAKSIRDSLKQLTDVLSDDDGELKVDFVKSDLSSGLGLKLSDSQVVDYEADRREQNIDMARSCQMSEKVIENGAQVTAFGTYHANPPRMDIGNAMTNLDHGLFPGTMAQVIRGMILKSCIAVAVFAAATGYAHWALYMK